jgi:hypothetical protein
MAAKQSQEMRNALRLVAEGYGVRPAAKVAEVWYTSVYAVLAKERRAVVDSAKAQKRELRDKDTAAQAIAARLLK